MKRPLLAAKSVPALALGAGAVIATSLLCGCPSTATPTAYPPITGLRIDAQALVAGHGCGAGPTQVYRYLAVVKYAASGTDASQGVVAAQVFDCFADGIFSNLPAASDGSLSFDVTIRAWNKASFPAQLNCVNASASTPCPAENASIDAMYENTANWMTSCTGRQTSGATQVATCPCPLASGDAGLCGDAGS